MPIPCTKCRGTTRGVSGIDGSCSACGGVGVAPDEPQPDETYRHFRGGSYTVIAVATKEDTGEPLVVYRDNLDGVIWARALEEFTGTVSDADGWAVPRFERVDH